MNQIILIGRTGKDPEVKYLDGGKVVANLTLAVNSFKREDPPEWFNLEMWGKTAEIAADWVKRGDQICVTGSIVTQKWTDRQTGEERSKPVVKVNSLELLGSKRDRELGDGAAQPASRPAARPQQSPSQRRAVADGPI
jgi:single-strand DNA-binding protein